MMVALVLVLLHLLLHVGLGIGPAAPDLFTLAVLVVARETTMPRAGLLGLVLGLVEDAQGLLSFGANTVALAMVGIIAARTRDFFVGDSLLFGASYLFLGKWLRDLIRWIAVGEGLREPFFGSVVLESGLAAAYLTVLGLGVLVLLGSVPIPGESRS
jgi:hypothetical protein